MSYTHKMRAVLTIISHDEYKPLALGIEPCSLQYEGCSANYVMRDYVIHIV